MLGPRLEEVRRWSQLRPRGLSIARRLRTPELEPDLEEEPTLAGVEAAVQELAVVRGALLAHAPTIPPGAHPGRLLVCELGMSVGGGESETRSRGFFDVDDRPPWDIWLVCFGRRRASAPGQPIACLLAWVPDDLVDVARAGIEANRCDCIYWAGDRDDALRRQLESYADLLA
jgi:hypothetical protein